MAGPLNSGNLVSCGCATKDKPGLRSLKQRSVAAGHDHARRTRKKGAGGKFTAAEIDALMLKQKCRCANCGVKLNDKNMARDHRKAVANGGSSDILNMELLCKPCNGKKGAKDEIVWAQQNGRLI